MIDLLADMLKNHSLSSTDGQATSNSHVTPNISKRLALKAPETFRAGQDVRQWLVKIENHLELSGIYPEYQAKCAAQFLDDEPLRTWQAESSSMRREGKAATFEEFKNCLMKYYCTKLQVRELRDQYENLKQTGSVIDFVRETKRLIHELADDETFAIGKGEAITNFLKHVKEPVRNYLYEHAPKPDWWREPEELFEAAHHYELNENAARPLKARTSYADKKEVNNLQVQGGTKKRWNTYHRTATASRGRAGSRVRGRG